jgi:hypothetical protein
LKQTFHIGYDNNITFKEGYNLMSGRAVHKEMAKLIDTSEPGLGLPPRLEAKGEKYNTWLKMDFSDTDKQGNFKMKQFTDAYGFKLDEALAKHPIKELRNEDDKISLMESLQKGNRQAVTFLINGKEEKRFIEASPQHWNINIYDANMEKMDYKKSRGKEQGESAQQSEGQAATASRDKKQAEKHSDAPLQKKRQIRQRVKEFPQADPSMTTGATLFLFTILKVRYATADKPYRAGIRSMESQGTEAGEAVFAGRNQKPHFSTRKAGPLRAAGRKI